MNFIHSMNDQCLLMKNDKNRTIIICLYIDNMLCVGDTKAIDIFKEEIKKIFLLQRKKEKQMNMLGV